MILKISSGRGYEPASTRATEEEEERPAEAESESESLSSRSEVEAAAPGLLRDADASAGEVCTAQEALGV